MRIWQLHDDGSATLIDQQPGPFSSSPPIESTVVELTTSDVDNLQTALHPPKAADAPADKSSKKTKAADAPAT